MNWKNAAFDTARFIVISPEFLAIVLSWALCLSYDNFVLDILSYFPWDAPNFIIGFLGIPIALVAAAYKFGTDLLSKNRKLLLHSGLYRRCKDRVIFSCLLTIVSVAGTATGFVLIRTKDPWLAVIAAAIISSCLTSSMVSVATLAFADFTVKEIEDSNEI